VIIERLVIYGYGKWVDQSIQVKQPLQIVYGPNEAGKSTLVDFIKSILFGFQTKRQAVHGQYIPKNHSTYGGEIWFSESGRHYKIVRTQGTHGGDIKFYDLEHGRELTAADFQQLISPIDRQTYNQLFYFGDVNQSEVYKLGEMDLRRRIQQIGVAGANQWIDLQNELEKQSQELYAPRGRKKALNAQLRDYDKLVGQVEDAKHAFPKYQRIQAEIDQLSKKLQELQDKLLAGQKKAQQQRELLTSLPLATELQKLSRVSQSDIKDGFQDHDRIVLSRLTIALDNHQKELKQVKAKLKQLSDNQFETPVQKFYQANKRQIDELINQLATQRDLATRIEFLTNQQHENDTTLTRLVHSISSNPLIRVPRLFDDQTYHRVSDLLRQRQGASGQTTRQSTRQRVQRSVNRPNMPFFVIGALIFVGSLAIHQTMASWLGYFIGIMVLGWGWLHPKREVSTIQQSSQSPKHDWTFDEIDQQLNQIRSKFDLSDINEDRWLSIQPTIRQIKGIQADQAKVMTQLNNDQGKLQMYLDSWQFTQDWLTISADQPTEQLNQIEQAVFHWRRLLDDYQNEKKKVEIYQEMITNLIDKIKQVTLSKQTFFQQRGVTNDAEFNQLMADQQKIKRNLTRKTEVEQQLRVSKVMVPAGMTEIDVHHQIDNLNNQNNRYQQLINEKSQRRSELNIQLNDLVQNGRYYDFRQTLANQQTEIINSVHRYLALKLSSDWIQTVLNIATKGRLPKMLGLAKKYFQILTNQHYRDIIFEDRISVVRSDDVHFVIEELSKGTLEQLYLSLIFSMAVGFSSQYPMPIIIDDGFANFDQQRRQAAYEMLKQVSQQTQVIYFSANLNLEVDKSLVLNLNKL
jgi:uncharacterized protein YhaN